MIARLDRAVVLGAGTMGAQLACLLAGSGAAVQLLDLDGAIAADGLARALRLRPGPLRRPEDLGRITTGGFDTLDAAVAGAGWVIEAITEQAEPKRELLGRVDAALTGVAEWPIVSSNTSGLSIAALADGRSDSFRRRFLGTHFFNPPRYARLLEIVPSAETDSDVVAWVEDYGSRRLGKGTVRALDTPAFIANRLGVHEMLITLDLTLRLGLGVDEVDELTGPLIGRPRSATFRLLDLVGVDVAVAVADHCFASLPDDPYRDRYRVPSVLRTLVERGAVGEKRGEGMFKRVDGEILALDLETLAYRPRRPLASTTLELARGETSPERRFDVLLAGDDEVGHFARGLFAGSLGYAAAVAPDIADRAVTVDRAMRWGYGWELGPFETWDVFGVARTTELLRDEGQGIPELARRVLGGPGSFYAPEGQDGLASLGFADLTLQPIPGPPGHGAPAGRARRGPKLPGSESASVVELGDGILGLQLHGRRDVIDEEALVTTRLAVELAGDGGDGLVIATDGHDFCAGSDLAPLLEWAEDGAWTRVEESLGVLQAATRAVRYSPVPVVAAPRGRTVGGGAEICLAAARCQPLVETSVGLVDVGLGLIPAGGGATELVRRAALLSDGAGVDGLAFFRAAFETLATNRLSSSAHDGRTMGIFGGGDLATADPDRQWADASRVTRTLAEVGYEPPVDRPIRVLGRRGIAAVEALTYNQWVGRRLSDHDRTVVLELASAMCGGDVAEGTELAGTYLLDLEREGFLRLLGHQLTRDRIRYALRTGKTLLN